MALRICFGQDDEFAVLDFDGLEVIQRNGGARIVVDIASEVLLADVLQVQIRERLAFDGELLRGETEDAIAKRQGKSSGAIEVSASKNGKASLFHRDAELAF